jgi:glutamine amidotransferase
LIGIIDYGLGNIKAFVNIYKKLDVPLSVVSSKSDLDGISKIILPGVGAFDHAIDRFSKSGMRDQIERLVLDQKAPLIGICVGMQMLARSSEEGVRPGLGWIDGVVSRIDVTGLAGSTRLPHMGWNDVIRKAHSPILKSFPDSSEFYFLHSFCFHCDHLTNVVATANYGIEFAAIVARDNVFGIQCHPEKSHMSGIEILKNFAEL